MHKVYQTPSGNKVVLDFIRSLSDEEKKVVGEDLKAVDRLSHGIAPLSAGWRQSL
jgi:hypothetical protein